jgi:hypothetical protein
MELVPVVRPTKWLVGPGGEVQKYAPPPPPARTLTSGQQHAVYRIALAHTLRLLSEHGFSTNCIEQSSTALGLSGLGMDININIREPARVAYVTSVPGDNGQRRVLGKDAKGNNVYAPGPGVHFASDEIDAKYVVEVQFSRVSSSMPVYVVIPAGSRQPVMDVLKSILSLIASFAANENMQRQLSTDTSDWQLKELPAHLQRELGDAFKMLDMPPL